MLFSRKNVQIACVQMAPRIGEKDLNVRRAIDFVTRAADLGAELVVLPELANTGYVFDSRAEAESLAEPVPDGSTTAAWSEVASALGVYIVAGIAEKADGALYNSAVLLGPDGYLGSYRKTHLWGDEKKLFASGDRPSPIYDTPLGRIAIAICYDLWFPELFRLYALGGAQIVCVPTNWVPMPNQSADRPAMANTLAMAAAHTNGLVVACADRVGVERGQPFEGQSLVVDQSGWPVGDVASRSLEEIVSASITLDARTSVGTHNDVLADRRADIYGRIPAFDGH
ncbi:UNVERIFIED_CONTAM: hydratase [Mumia flava]|nr:nitrilase family protein [Burkholderia cenocepacia]